VSVVYASGEKTRTKWQPVVKKSHQMFGHVKKLSAYDRQTHSPLNEHMLSSRNRLERV